LLLKPRVAGAFVFEVVGQGDAGVGGEVDVPAGAAFGVSVTTVS